MNAILNTYMSGIWREMLRGQVEVLGMKSEMGVICMVVTGGTMRTDEILREGLGMGCHCMKRQLNETPEEQSKRKEKIQLIH